MSSRVGRQHSKSCSASFVMPQIWTGDSNTEHCAVWRKLANYNTFPSCSMVSLVRWLLVSCIIDGYASELQSKKGPANHKLWSCCGFKVCWIQTGMWSSWMPASGVCGSSNVCSLLSSVFPPQNQINLVVLPIWQKTGIWSQYRSVGGSDINCNNFFHKLGFWCLFYHIIHWRVVSVFLNLNNLLLGEKVVNGIHHLSLASFPFPID